MRSHPSIQPRQSLYVWTFRSKIDATRATVPLTSRRKASPVGCSGPGRTRRIHKEIHGSVDLTRPLYDLLCGSSFGSPLLLYADLCRCVGLLNLFRPRPSHSTTPNGGATFAVSRSRDFRASYLLSTQYNAHLVCRRDDQRRASRQTWQTRQLD